MEYDAVVVGAGPAGSSAAKGLAGKGLKVLLAERQKEIGKTVFCAEAVSKRTISKVELYDNSFAACEIDRARFFGPDNDGFTIEAPGVAYVLERRVFDRALAEGAARAGAEIRLGHTFTGMERQNGKWKIELRALGKTVTVQAPLVVGADGPGSAVGNAAGMDVKMDAQDGHHCAQVHLVDNSIEPNVLDFFVGRDVAPGGYGWVFSKHRGMANVGLGVSAGEGIMPAWHYLDRFLAERFPNVEQVGRQTALVPTGALKTQLFTDGVLLCGDAARAPEPLSGGGIGPGIVTGNVAAKCGALCLEGLAKWSDYPDFFWSDEALSRTEYEIAHRIREHFLTMDDDTLTDIISKLKRAFDGKVVEVENGLDAARLVFSSAPGILALALKVGGKALVKYFQAVLS